MLSLWINNYKRFTVADDLPGCVSEQAWSSGLSGHITVDLNEVRSIIPYVGPFTLETKSFITITVWTAIMIEYI